MARPRKGSEWSVADLEKLLANRKTELDGLMRDRAKLQKQIDTIDDKISRLGGGAVSISLAPSGSRAKNDKSLIDTIVDVLSSADGPIGVGEIVQGVESAGYRSTSANFRGIVNQTLIKERKRFVSTSRGMYQIKK